MHISKPNQKKENKKMKRKFNMLELICKKNIARTRQKGGDAFESNKKKGVSLTGEALKFYSYSCRVHKFNKYVS